MAEVVVGIDGSEGSRRALRWAAAAAGALGARLRAVWVWQYPSDVVLEVGGVALLDRDRADAEAGERLRVVVEEELGDRAGAVETDVRRGPAGAALVRAADGARLLVVGARGLGGFRGLLLGSVSRQVSEHASCPVTIVRRDVEGHLPARTVVVGVDGSEDARRAMLFAAQVAAAFGAELRVVHAAGGGDVVRPPGLESEGASRQWRELALEEWCAPLHDAGAAYRAQVVEGDPRVALPEVAEDVDADLVVVGSRGSGAVGRLVLGSVATALSHRSDVPLTIVPGVRSG